MAQEFFINSDQLEAKIRNLFPSQGGFGAGFDLSASTQIVPIVDLTETAEGSRLRQDLQTAFSHTASDLTTNSSGTVDLVTTTGYFKVLYSFTSTGTPGTGEILINDGASDKKILRLFSVLSGSDYNILPVTG